MGQVFPHRQDAFPASPLKPLHLLIAITATNHVNFVGARFAVLLYAVHLEASPATVGVLTALFSVLGITTSVATGRWIDRIGPRYPMIICSLLMAAATAVAWFWEGIYALFILSIVVGTAYNVYFIGNQLQIGHYGRPEDKVGNFSLAMQGYAMASFIAPLVAGFAIDEIGYRDTFLLLALLPLVPTLVISLNKLELPSHGRAEQKQARPGGGVGELLRKPALREIFMMALLTNVGWNLYTFLMPLYGSQIHLSASQIGIIMSTYSLASVVSRMLAPVCSRRYTHWQILIGSLLMAAIGFVATSFFAQMGVLISLAFWMGLALGISAPISLALIHEASPADRMAEVQGLRLAIINGLQTAVPLTAGMIGAALGVGPVFWAVAALLAAGCYAGRGKWHAHRNAHATRH